VKEYIDREKLIAEYDRVHVGPAGGARKLMVDAPTEDVVEVVRCMDCKYWGIREGNDPNKNYFCNLENLWCKPARKSTDFCSHGERKMRGDG
jgi:hypothetical protein